MFFNVQGLTKLNFWQASVGLLWSCCSCQAQDFFKGKAEGWHWYEDRTGVQASANPQKVLPSPVPAQGKKKPLTPTHILRAYQKDLEEKLHRAVVDPTPANLVAYIEAQKAGQETAQRFAEAWMKVIYTHPHLDAAITRPVNHVGRTIYTAEAEKKRNEKIRRLARTHGLFFFFQGGCPYCEAFAPVVKGFAEKYGFKVLAISLDGKPVEGVPDFQKDNGIAARFNIRHVPALLAVNPREGRVIPLAHGFLAEAELEKRLDVLADSLTPSPEIQP